MKKRVEFIDLAKGICILLIVFNHTFGKTAGSALESLMIFRMPLYFVLSGLFFKSYGNLSSFFKKKVNKLLIPMLLAYIIVSIPSTFFLNIYNGIPVTISNLFLMPTEPHKLNFGLSPSSWFLLCLFWLNILFYFIFLISKKNISAIVIISLLCGFVGYYCNIQYIILPIWVDTALTSIPFFCVGYVIRNFTNVLEESFSYKYLVILSLSALILLFCISLISDGDDILYAGNHYDVSPLCLYLGGISGTICVLIIAKYKNNLPVVSYMGRYSIVILLTHQFYLFVIRNILYQLNLPQDSLGISLGVFLIIIIISLPTIKYGIKYMPYFFAQKEIWK